MKKFNKSTVAFTAIAASIFIFSSTVIAAGIPLSVIGPHEYALPVNYEPFNAVAQYSFIQTDNMAFDSAGKRVDGPGTFTAVGFTKYVRFFTFKSLPDVGFAWEWLRRPFNWLGCVDKAEQEQHAGVAEFSIDSCRL